MQMSHYKSLLSYYRSLGLFLFVCGLFYFISLCDLHLNSATYISEKALSPGVVDEQFHSDDSLRDYYNVVREKYYKDNIDSGHFQEWLRDQMSQIGLDSHVHNFSLDFSLLLGNQRIHGSNVIGILRAYRSFRTEAVVITAPLRPIDGIDPETSASIALMLALAKFFRRQTFWAKDIVLVFPEMETVGLQAWLDQYHGVSSSSHISSSELKYRSGSIQCAFNLAVSTMQFGPIDINIEGVNGILPNLDLVNTVVRIGRKHGINLRLHGRRDVFFPDDPLKNLEYWSQTMLKMMLQQASGSPSSLHGLFLPYEIPAVGLSAEGITTGPFRLKSLALLLEGALRSVNNLQERFHQSFFFYLLPSTDRYVSIGLYMPPFALVSLGLVLSSLDVLLNNVNFIHDPNNVKKTEFPPLSPIVRLFLLAYGFAAFAFSAPSYFVRLAASFGVDPGSGLLSGMVAIQIVAMAYPRLVKSSSLLACDEAVLRLTSCLYTALTLGAVALVNFSLSFFAAVLLVPASLLSCKRSVKSLWWLAFCQHIVASPLGMLILGCFLNGSSNVGVLSNAESGLLQTVVEESLLGSWTYRFFTIVLFPVWIISWTRLFVEDTSISPAPVDEATKANKLGSVNDATTSLDSQS